MKRFLARYGMALLLLTAACSDMLSGGGTDVGNGSNIAVAVLKPDGEPASGVLVRIRPSEYLTPLYETQVIGPGVADSTTDLSGNVAFSGLPFGKFRIECIDSTNKVGAIIDHEVGMEAVSTLPPIVLKPLGRTDIIFRPQRLPTMLAAFRVQGLERKVTAQASDTARIVLPPGDFEVYLHSIDNGGISATTHVDIQSAQISSISDHDFTCTNGACDYAIMDQFLKDNKLPLLPWQFIDSTGRVSSIRLSDLPPGLRLVNVDALPRLGSLKNIAVLGECISGDMVDTMLEKLQHCKSLRTLQLSWGWGRNLRSISDSIGSLTQLEELYLVGDSLFELPSTIGRLVNLRILAVSQNGLSQIPPEVGNLVNLRELDFSFNAIEQLPESVYRLPNLRNVGSWSNRLCTLNDEQQRWFMERSTYFGPNGQTCD